MQFAVIKTGGKQYRVSEGDMVAIEKLEHLPEVEFDFEEVLLIGGDTPEMTKIGTPLVGGAKVRAMVVEQYKDDKKIVFKYKAKTREKTKKGHRQPMTKVRILKITA